MSEILTITVSEQAAIESYSPEVRNRGAEPLHTAAIAPRRSDLSRLRTVVVNTVAPKKQHPGLCWEAAKENEDPAIIPLRRH